MPHHINEGFENLKILDPNKSTSEWYFNLNKSEDQIPNLKFWRIRKSIFHKEGIVPLKKVTGTSHPSYQNKMWIEVLGSLSRFKDYNWDKDTFIEKAKSAPLNFSKYGDNYYIIGGNNRTTVAKFLEFEYLKGSVVEYFFDDEFFKTYLEIQKAKLNPKLQHYDRNENWNLTINNKNIFISGFNNVASFLSYYNSVKLDYKSLIKRKVLCFKKSNNNHRFIRVKNDIYNLQMEIIEHKVQLENT